MLSKYKDIATADVNVKFNAKKNEGFIDFRIKDINFKDASIRLKQRKTPLEVKYTISNIQDIIDAEKSIWVYNNDTELSVSKLKLPFTLKTLTTKIPEAYIDIEDKLSAKLSGEVTLSPTKLRLNVNLSKFNMSGIKMAQNNAFFKVLYSNALKIDSNKKIDFKVGNLDCFTKNINIHLEHNILNIADTDMGIKKMLNMQVNAKYDVKDKNATINIKKINIKDDDLGSIFYAQNNIKLDLKSNKNKTTVQAKQLGMKYIMKKDSWKFNCNSLSKLYTKSKLLRDYNISNGQLGIYKTPQSENINFIVNTNYPYKFLVLDNKPIENYTIKGEVDQKTKDISVNINNIVDIQIDDKIDIKTRDIGININDILSYSKHNNSDLNTTSNDMKDIYFKAKDSYIYISKNRHVISQNINLTYIKGIVNANLKYKQGDAKFKLNKHNIYLYGDGFNDEFMDNLFALSKFQGGVLSFSLSGTTKEYDALINIENTTIHDYKILNNILAFVNTVPSLMTFSVPGYNKYGLEVQSAYASIHSKDDVFHINNFYLDSKELDILGGGTANFITNQVNLTLNLKTNLGSSVSKIPLVGYILLGEDTVSTSMKISGKLDDPKIKSLIAKDIVVAPLNILKRTLNTPLQIFNKKR
jgi:Fe-S cluster assembly iron-binding protein IscA